MTTPNLGVSLPVRLANPVSQWTEALAAFAKTLRMALPCIVVSFDSTKQTIVAQPVINEVARNQDGKTFSPQQLPQLVDVPVILPRGGPFTLTLPIQAGDECLVIFGDTCFDAWWQSGGTNNNEFEQRRHSLADGFAVFGPWSQPRVLSSYSTSSAQLRNEDGTVTIDVAANAVTVTAPTVNVTGSQHVNISGNGETSIEGRNFLQHTHSGVASGGASSGPVV
jgi:hypothetical protein